MKLFPWGRERLHLVFAPDIFDVTLYDDNYCQPTPRADARLRKTMLWRPEATKVVTLTYPKSPSNPQGILFPNISLNKEAAK